MTNRNRRHFIKTSLLGIPGAGLAAGTEGKFPNPEARDAGIPLLKRTLGKTGIRVPVIGMGCEETYNPNLVNAALDRGLMMFTTSREFGNGRNERMVGKVLKGRKRDTYLIGTDANPDGIDHKQGLYKPETDAKKFKRDMESCLVNLEMETVDIFFLPFAARRESVFFEPLLRVMEDMKREGKCRFIGIATHKFESEAIRAAADTGIYDIVMTAYNFKHPGREEIDQALAYAAGRGLGTIAMKTMAGVYWDKEKTRPINSVAALKWVVQNENIHTTVPGFTTFDQLDSDVSIMADPTLTEEEKQSLIPPAAARFRGLFCEQCGQCLAQCPASIDIPTLMRAYMYAYGYKNLEHARQAVLASGCKNNPCGTCQTCQVRCSMHFDIRGRVSDIIRLREVPGDILA
jgi:predicted aldo/keto reductase-like oxidoreductase